MKRHSTQQVNTRKFVLTTKNRGVMEFITFGALANTVTDTELASGQFMSGGRVESGEIEAEFYAVDVVLAAKLERWRRDFENGGDAAFEEATATYLRTNGTPGMVVNIEQLAVKGISYPEMDEAGDGEAGRVTVTFKYFNAARTDVG